MEKCLLTLELGCNSIQVRGTYNIPLPSDAKKAATLYKCGDYFDSNNDLLMLLRCNPIQVRAVDIPRNIPYSHRAATLYKCGHL